MIKIGLDFHGTITNDPDFFRELSELAMDKGHEVHIITGGFHKSEAGILKEYGIKHTQVFSMYDYFKGLDKVTYCEDGTFRVDDEIWDKTKGEYCKEYGIDFMIDDTLKYGKHFKTPYCHYDAKSFSGIVNGRHRIALSSPASSLDDIIKHVSDHKSTVLRRGSVHDL